MPGQACPFCNLHEPLLENELAVAKPDRNPVSEGHLLIIPKRHAVDWFDLTDAERGAVNDLLLEAKAWLDDRHRPDGYNIGMNCGEAAGQTVFHMHCHLIPRYAGDTDDPTGGVCRESGGMAELDEYAQRFKRLNVNRAGGVSPHKPCMLLALSISSTTMGWKTGKNGY